MFQDVRSWFCKNLLFIRISYYNICVYLFSFAVQSHNAVSAYFSSKQILLFGLWRWANIKTSSFQCLAEQSPRLFILLFFSLLCLYGHVMVFCISFVCVYANASLHSATGTITYPIMRSCIFSDVISRKVAVRQKISFLIWCHKSWHQIRKLICRRAATNVWHRGRLHPHCRAKLKGSNCLLFK